jgi:hypothetical protein
MNGNKAETYAIGTIGAGVAVLIFSFLPYYGVSSSVKIGGRSFGASASVTAWHSYATLAILLLLLAAGLLAARAFGGVRLPETVVSVNFAVFALAALGTLLFLLRSFTLPSGGGGGLYSYGLKFGAYLVILAALAETACAFLVFRESGEPLPWAAPRPGAVPPTA